MAANRQHGGAQMAAVVGWDVGGAHLKAARVEGGRVVAAVQVASPLRFGLEALAAAFADAKPRMGAADRHVITMTGELADTFASRADGVGQLTTHAVRMLAPEPVLVYGGRAGFLTPLTAPNHVADVASANWHASAQLVAHKQRSALFIDMGSTTTDLVPVIEGALAARGYSDAERLATDELVYTGLVRSAVMAVAERAPMAGSWSGLVRETFATMADVYRVLGTLPPTADQMPTADGRPKTREASRARLARMVGRDEADAAAADWDGLAQFFAEAQIRRITDAAMRIVSRGGLSLSAPIVTAGIGAMVIDEVARRLHRQRIGFETLLDMTPGIGAQVSQCAPAAALALLAFTASGEQTSPHGWAAR
jgi:(4-(4-[2-(gamma-L-glutamylamino)ethyl]phenoxymethyl)furan-2-yl)methanamine synthase